MSNVADESPAPSKGEGWREVFQISALCGLVIAFTIVFCVAILKWIPDWIRDEYGPDIFTSVFHPTRTEQIKKLRLELATSQREMELREAEISKLSEPNAAAELTEHILKLRVAVYRLEFQLKELGAEPPPYVNDQAKTLLNDPQFYAQPLSEQIDGLSQISPEFNGLPYESKKRVLAETSRRVKLKTPHNSQ